MKNLLLTSLLLFCVLLLSAASKDVAVTIKLTESSNDIVYLLFGDKKDVISLDANLESVVVYKNCKAGYAKIVSGGVFKLIYLEPGKDLKITIIPSDADWYKKFEYKGLNADINNYLSYSDSIKLMDVEDFKLKADEYIQKLKDLTELNIKRMESFNFSEKFEKAERIRLKYLVHSTASRYLVQHFWVEPNKMTGVEQYDEVPEMKAYLESLLIDDASYWEIEECRNYYSNVIAALTREGMWESEFYDDILKRCSYVKGHFKSDCFREGLIHHFAMVFIDREEGHDLGDIMNFYTEMVKSPELKEKLVAKQNEWKMMRKGADFTIDDYMDITGKKVNFNDLRGKYVYIDVWATWCGPCCAEIPYLKTLEEKMYDKNIYFVSLSVDNSKTAWMNKVKSEKMGGIQLYGGANAKIKKDYSIEAIPRFILLDKEGKLINARMTRPSEEVTLKTLNQLEGI